MRPWGLREAEPHTQVPWRPLWQVQPQSGTLGTKGLCALLSVLIPHYWLAGSAQLGGQGGKPQPPSASGSPFIQWGPGAMASRPLLVQAFQVPTKLGLQQMLKPPTALGSEGQGRWVVEAQYQPYREGAAQPTGQSSWPSPPASHFWELHTLRGDLILGFLY